jgi:hypothetical protein
VGAGAGVVCVGDDATGVGEAGADALALAAVTLDPSSIDNTATTAAAEATRMGAGRAAKRRDENMDLPRDARRRIDRGTVAR